MRHRPLPLLLYRVLPLPFAIYMAVSVSPSLAVSFVGGLLLLPNLYSGLTALYMKLLASGQRGAWSYGWRLPWLGLLPAQHVSLRIMTGIHHQLLWIGSAIIVCLFPWIGKDHVLMLLALHIWYLLPRFWIFFVLRRAKKPGLLKIGDGDTSYYIQ